MGQRNVVRGVLGGVALLLVARLPVAAQPAPEGPEGLEPGTRVRVTCEADPGGGGSAKRFVGTLDALGPETLRLDVSRSGTETIPRDAIVRLERSVRRGRKTRGALIGFGVGFATFFTLAELGNNEGCFSGGHECGLDITASAVLALPVAAVGALVAPGEVWAEVPLGSGPAATASTGGRGLQLRVAPLVGRQTGVALVGSF